MKQLANAAALAFGQLEYRSTLERAAFTDELTGAATRARLRRELDDGMTWSAVLVGHGGTSVTLGASVGVCVRQFRLADTTLGTVEQDGKGRYPAAAG